MFPRTKNIAYAFFKAGYIESCGRGYQKIREGFEPAGIPMPQVENFCVGVRVSIERTKFIQMMNVTSNVVSNVVSMSVVQLTDRQKEKREMILKDSFISAKQMSVVLSVDSRTVQRDLAAMQKKGVLIREGNTSAGHWIVIEPAKQKNGIDPNGVVANWMRNRNTIEYLGLWETLHNANFNPIEFEGFRKETGLNAFTLSPTRWIDATNAIGLVSRIWRTSTPCSSTTACLRASD